MKKRRQFSPEYKAKAALEVLKGQRTLNGAILESGVWQGKKGSVPYWY